MLLHMVLLTAILPMEAFVVIGPRTVPSPQQQQQQLARYPLHFESKSTQLQEKKRTKGSSGGSGFGNVVKDILSSSSTTASAPSSSTFPFTGTVRPGKQSPQRIVMDEIIMKPDYWQSGTPLRTKKGLLPWMIEVKTSDEILKMREAGKLARHILDLAGRAVRPGITTDEIDTIVHNEIIQVRFYTYTKQT